ncbi:NF-X1-type zinc finger protein [Pelomyxa schiedti]|nr:NF-X1-type zinc finger protein [Pelomyxa schiedti]
MYYPAQSAAAPQQQGRAPAPMFGHPNSLWFPPNQEHLRQQYAMQYCSYHGIPYTPSAFPGFQLPPQAQHANSSQIQQQIKAAKHTQNTHSSTTPPVTASRPKTPPTVVVTTRPVTPPTVTVLHHADPQTQPNAPPTSVSGTLTAAVLPPDTTATVNSEPSVTTHTSSQTSVTPVKTPPTSPVLSSTQAPLCSAPSLATATSSSTSCANSSNRNNSSTATPGSLTADHPTITIITTSINNSVTTTTTTTVPTGSSAARTTECVEQSTLCAQMTKKIETNSYECMICFEVIPRTADIWSCGKCWGLFHIQCIKKWKETSNQQAPTPHTIDAILHPPPKVDTRNWRCPTCRYEFLTPPKSSCYCGKVENASSHNLYALPHSCGARCGRSRVGTPCPHECTLVCHPGPCPPCPALGPVRNCFCGRTKYATRCSDIDNGQSCGAICGQSLNCLKHTCASPCHPGKCKPCPEAVEQKCYCGRVTESRACGTGSLDQSQGEDRYFCCNQVCDKQLDCKNHNCKKLCHAGPCGDCELLPSQVTTCPCKSVPLYRLLKEERKSCLDEIPTCGRPCNKKLECGHNCLACCHTGPCPPCTTEVHVYCRCKSTTALRPCTSKNIPVCNKPCEVMKSCGRHLCRTVCCPSRCAEDIPGNHVCRIVCNKQLECRKHKCEILCHLGPCPSCFKVKMEEVSCRCGKTVLHPPIPCGTKLPPCPFPCSIPRKCGHKDVPVYGDMHSCHQGACPPCTMLVSKMCMGGHELRKNVQCYLESVSCGKVCGKQLPCGLHLCQKLCHLGPCFEPPPPAKPAADKQSRKKNKKKKKSAHTSSTTLSTEATPSNQPTETTQTSVVKPLTEQPTNGQPSEQSASSAQQSKPNTSTSSSAVTLSQTSQLTPSVPPKISCGQVCGAKRTTCQHLCKATCHPGTPCPSILCTDYINIFCPCKRRCAQVECLHGGKPNEGFAGPEQRELECDEECAVLSRNKRLADALGIMPEVGAPSYPKVLVVLGKSQMPFLLHVEEILGQFVSSTNPTVVLSAVDKGRRQLLVQLLRYYGLYTTAFTNPSPGQTQEMILTKTPQTRVPSVLLSQVAISSSNASQDPTVTILSYGEDEAPQFLMSLGNLDSGAVNLKYLLGKDSCIQWLDKRTCLVLFKRPEQMNAAIKNLSCTFVVETPPSHCDPTKGPKPPRPYKPATPAPTTNVWVQRQQSRNPAAAAAALHPPTEEPTWRQNNNYYAHLQTDETE